MSFERNRKENSAWVFFHDQNANARAIRTKCQQFFIEIQSIHFRRPNFRHHDIPQWMAISVLLLLQLSTRNANIKSLQKQASNGSDTISVICEFDGNKCVVAPRCKQNDRVLSQQGIYVVYCWFLLRHTPVYLTPE